MKFPIENFKCWIITGWTQASHLSGLQTGSHVYALGRWRSSTHYSLHNSQKQEGKGAIWVSSTSFALFFKWENKMFCQSTAMKFQWPLIGQGCAYTASRPTIRQREYDCSDMPGVGLGCRNKIRLLKAKEREVTLGGVGGVLKGSATRNSTFVQRTPSQRLCWFNLKCIKCWIIF